MKGAVSLYTCEMLHMSWVIEGLLINYWKFSLFFLVNDPEDSVLKHEQKDI